MWLPLKGACESDMDQQSMNSERERAHGFAHGKREEGRSSIIFAFVEGKDWHVTKGGKDSEAA